MTTHHSNLPASSTKQAEPSNHETRIQALEAALHATQMQLQLEHEQHSAAITELQVAKEFVEKIVDTVRESLLILTPDLHVHSANQTFYTQFQVNPEHTEGQLIYDLGNQQWDIPALHTLLEEVLPNNKVFNDFEVAHEFEQLGQRTMLLNARRLDHVQFILLAIEDITERKQAEEALHHLNSTLEEQVTIRTKQVRSLSAKLTMTEQEERRRIAQVLHDDLQQQLYGIQMRLMSLMTNELPPSLLTYTQEAYEWLGDSIRITRRLTVDLSPPILKDEGLADALNWLVSQMDEMYKLEVTIQATHAFRLPDEAMRVLLFQIMRELLFNVVKHAQTNQATVELTEGDNNTLRIIVQDRGCGFDVTTTEMNQQGFGLSSIRERLSLFNGHLDIASTPGRGTRITLTLPMIVASPQG